MFAAKNRIRSLTQRLRKLEADMILIAHDIREVDASHASELEGAAKTVETWVVGLKNRRGK